MIRVSLSSAARVHRLERIKTSFSPDSARERLRIIDALTKSRSSSPFRSAKLLETYHDLLCMARAYPDSNRVLKLVESELLSFGDKINTYRELRRDLSVAAFDDSGIVNTSVSNAFSYEMARFLASHYPSTVEIDWAAIEDGGVDYISSILGQLVSWQENDTLDNDDSLETKDWLESGTTARNRTALQVLLTLLDNPKIPYSLQKHLYESAEVPIRWHLTGRHASRTVLRLKSPRVFYQTEPLAGRTRNLRADLSQPAIPLRLVSAREGAIYVRAIREVLASRVRELYPLTNSNAGEVYVAEPGRGMQIVIFGTIPRVRLPLEANFGALLIRNGIPIGYGVAAVLFDRVEIAINIFPAFRNGESSFVIEHFFKLFHHHFGSQLFLVRAYQVGEDNEEALESGSFWFYYKLGFRPVKPEVRNLAEREAKKIALVKGYRTSMRTLKRLAKSDVFFHADEVKMKSCNEMSIIKLGIAVTRLAAKRFSGNRQHMEIETRRALLTSLGNPSIARWSDDELTALQHLSPLLSMIPRLRQWSRVEKRDLLEIIRAKGSIHERRFVSLSQKHARLFTSLQDLSRQFAIRVYKNDRRSV